MYQVLYRKWRPQTFSDVYGQPHITTALKNELRAGRLAHAYLFTGSRGTGKTSCAKILAKAVNCLHPVDGDPCNECAICRGIDDGSVLDVAEIDAASNNGVDNIRDLRQEVHFTPTVGKYRVYIIDEVHMLSAGAFNALLKTLEEPPAHVIFVLATTEVHKLPATILSRCQRFDFNRIAPADIAARMQYVAGQERFTLADDAALLIARLADGGMRDALSLLDQCLSRSREITADVVAAAAGMAGREHLYAMADAIRTQNGAAGLQLVHELYTASCDMERLCVEMIEFFRGLMILKSVQNAADLVVTTPAELERMRGCADTFELTAVLHVLDVMQSAMERLKQGGNRRMEMEMAVLRLCSPDLDTGAAGMLRRIKDLEDAVRLLSAGGLPAAPAVETAAVSQTPPVVSPPPVGEKPPPVVSPPPVGEKPAPAVEAPPVKPAPAEPPSEEERPLTRWDEVLEILSTTCPPLYGVLTGSSAVTRGDMVLIQTDNALFRSLVGADANKQQLMEAVMKVTGQKCRIGLRKLPPPSEPAVDPLADFLRRSRDLGVEVDVKE
ncbi:MAG: DNA polymerase III subunit gamma/tau [Acutalibacteraceae bacterium]